MNLLTGARNFFHCHLGLLSIVQKVERKSQEEERRRKRILHFAKCILQRKGKSDRLGTILLQVKVQNIKAVKFQIPKNG